MKKIAAILLLTIFALGAEEAPLEVKADHFTNIDKEKKAIFEGHAHATQGKSWIKGDKFIVFFDQDGNARKYQAIGNVNFEIIKPEQHVKGKCGRLTYQVTNDTYLLEKHAVLDDLLNKRKMEGEKIFLDNKGGRATAESGKKGPVKFIFQMKETKKSGSDKKKR